MNNNGAQNNAGGWRKGGAVGRWEYMVASTLFHSEYVRNPNSFSNWTKKDIS